MKKTTGSKLQLKRVSVASLNNMKGADAGPLVLNQMEEVLYNTGAGAHQEWVKVWVYDDKGNLVQEDAKIWVANDSSCGAGTNGMASAGRC
ncbi:MAG: hypothetical protein IPL79_17580 [Myxococcales bacterium]|nr:hypothetical protein [Myxococcales bacterium]